MSGKGTADQLAQSVFGAKGKKPSDISVYEVNDEREEVDTIAGHVLADTSPRIDKCYIIRIKPSDLVGTGVRIDDGVLGTTGIVRVDFRHRDLVGTQEQIGLMVGVILKQLAGGCDRVRVIGVGQLRPALTRFAALSNGDRPRYTAQIIQRVLAGVSLDGLTVVQAELEEDLARLQMPEEATRLRAFCLYESKQGSGSAEGDWEMAAEQLRAAYRQHYSEEVAGRLKGARG